MKKRRKSKQRQRLGKGFLPKKRAFARLLPDKDSNRDPAGTQTQDLQNRNLTLYSLSYGAVMWVQK